LLGSDTHPFLVPDTDTVLGLDLHPGAVLLETSSLVRMGFTRFLILLSQKQMFSRNVGNPQSTLQNIPEQRYSSVRILSLLVM
jgi:hypothetical protein